MGILLLGELQRDIIHGIQLSCLLYRRGSNYAERHVATGEAALKMNVNSVLENEIWTEYGSIAV